MNKKKVCVIILDGMPYSILNGLLNIGIMPNLANVYNNAKKGVIQSAIPITPLVWSSMITGKTPYQSGICDVRSIDRYYNIYKRTIGRDNIFTALNANGIRTGIFNAPYVDPVYRVNGFFTTGKGGPGKHRDIAYPYTLKKKLFDSWGGEHEFIQDINKNRFRNDPIKLIDLVKKVNNNRIKFSIYAIKKYKVDFFLGFFTETDKLFHVTWNNLLNVASGNIDGPIEEQLVSLFKEIDKNLNSLFSSFRGNLFKIVLSDHGFGPLDYRFNLDQWLVDNGFTVILNNEKRPYLKKPEIKSLIKLLMPNNIKKPIFRTRDIIKSVSNNEYLQTKADNNLRNIDWHNTKAFALTGISIYVNNTRFKHGQIKSKEGYESLMREIVFKLKQLKLPDGDFAFHDILTKADFKVPALGITDGPDIVINPGRCSCNRPTYNNAHSDKDPYFVPTLSGDDGTHRKEGFILINGHGIKPGKITRIVDHTEFPAIVFKLFNLEKPRLYSDRIARNIF